MPSDPRDECFGRRHQLIGVVHSEHAELAFEKVEQVADDLKVPQPQLMKGEG